MHPDLTTPLASTKKCPHCGQWTSWQQQPDDRCEHCQQTLEPHRVANDQARQALDAKSGPNLVLIDINPDDPLPLRLAKYVIRGASYFLPPLWPSWYG